MYVLHDNTCTVHVLRTCIWKYCIWGMSDRAVVWKGRKLTGLQTVVWTGQFSVDLANSLSSPHPSRPHSAVGKREGGREEEGEREREGRREKKERNEGGWVSPSVCLCMHMYNWTWSLSMCTCIYMCMYMTCATPERAYNDIHEVVCCKPWECLAHTQDAQGMLQQLRLHMLTMYRLSRKLHNHVHCCV